MVALNQALAPRRDVFPMHHWTSLRNRTILSSRLKHEVHVWRDSGSIQFFIQWWTSKGGGNRLRLSIRPPLLSLILSWTEYPSTNKVCQLTLTEENVEELEALAQERRLPKGECTYR